MTAAVTETALSDNGRAAAAAAVDDASTLQQVQHVLRGNDSTPGAFLVTAVQCERLCKGDGKLCSGQGDGQRAFLAVVQLAILLQLGGAVLLVPACNQASLLS